MKSLIKVAAFILFFAAQILVMDLAIQFLFHKSPDLLLHHGIGQLAFYLLFIFDVVPFQ